MLLTEAKENELREFVLKLLYDRFGDEFVFDPILIQPKTDYIHGDEYLLITIVLDGDGSKLDAGWTMRMTGFLRPKLSELGLPEIAPHLFVLKSEWEELKSEWEEVRA